MQNGDRFASQTLENVLDRSGANAILALRCSYLNGRFEDYWEDRREAIAA